MRTRNDVVIVDWEFNPIGVENNPFHIEGSVEVDGVATSENQETMIGSLNAIDGKMSDSNTKLEQINSNQLTTNSKIDEVMTNQLHIQEDIKKVVSVLSFTINPEDVVDLTHEVEISGMVNKGARILKHEFDRELVGETVSIGWKAGDLLIEGVTFPSEAPVDYLNLIGDSETPLTIQLTTESEMTEPLTIHVVVNYY